MGIRWGAAAGLAALGLLVACTDQEQGGDSAAPAAEPTTDAQCESIAPASVFTTLGWTPTPKGAEASVRGCRREAEQGYVEVRRRTADTTPADAARKAYDEQCATLDRTGTPGPGVPAPWLGADLTACATEPDPGAGVGLTKVVLLTADGQVWQLSLAVLARTPQDQVRAAAEELATAVSG